MFGMFILALLTYINQHK
ncbi:putative holin-like toxin [Apilactobacillus xinyiensis]|nr:putative holin-like toxin [Apilactobacillus xinyiensis]MCL0311553.1 putative holin-like toxin [Apilactobacillus xinyiensis]MCL0318303.1 putative holin-like toxin [Apilactobacillus xinyiensis]